MKQFLRTMSLAALALCLLAASASADRYEEVDFRRLPNNTQEFYTLGLYDDLDDAHDAAAILVAALCRWREAPEDACAMVAFLKGLPSLPEADRSYIASSLSGGKGYIPFSFFRGATAQNSYTPSVPYRITLAGDRDDYDHALSATIYVTPNGETTPRPIMMTRANYRENWKITSFQILGDITPPASTSDDQRPGTPGQPDQPSQPVISGKTETETFGRLPQNLNDFAMMDLYDDLDDESEVAAILVAALCRWRDNPEDAYAMVARLMGVNTLSDAERGYIENSLAGKGYKPFAFFAGATAQNGYTPALPYRITVRGEQEDSDRALSATIYVTPNGETTPRPITMTRANYRENWKITSFRILGDITPPASTSDDQRPGTPGQPDQPSQPVISGKTETETFYRLPRNAEDLSSPEMRDDLGDESEAAALLVAALCRWRDNPEDAYAMVARLMGGTSLSDEYRSYIENSLGSGKGYKPFAFFEGATQQNGYTPTYPYSITVRGEQEDSDRALSATIYVTPNGETAPRPIELRRSSAGEEWRIKSFRILGDMAQNNGSPSAPVNPGAPVTPADGGSGGGGCSGLPGEAIALAAAAGAAFVGRRK